MVRPGKAIQSPAGPELTGDLLASLFFAAPFGVQVFRADGRCVLTNPAFREKLRSPPPDYNLLHDESEEARRLRPLLRRALGGEKVVVNAAWARGDDRSLALAYTLIPLRHPDSGHIDHVALIVQDATLELTAREEASRLQRRLDHVLQLLENYRSHIMGILGHDLRTPLSVIKMSAEQLLRYGNLAEKHLRVAERMGTSTTQLTQMIAQVFDFTRSRVGEGIPLEPRPTDLAANCRMVVEELRAASPEHVIELETHGDTTGRWDSDRLRQAVTDLVKNAERFGPPGAAIRLTVRDAGPEVVMTVHNAGAPEFPNALPATLDPLRRGKPSGTQTPVARGLDLGLFIAQEIVRGHGGKILVQATPENGTTFTVRWPRQPPEEVPPPLLEKLDRD